MYEARLSRVFAVFAGALAILGMRAFALQVVERDRVLADHAARVHRSYVVVPHRGDILWADGTPAASDEPGWSVEIDPVAFQTPRWSCGVCGATTRRAASKCPEPTCGVDAALTLLPMPRLDDLAQTLGVSSADVAAAFEHAVAEQEKTPRLRYHELVSEVNRESAIALTLASERFPGVVCRARPRRTVDATAQGVVGRVRGAFPEDVLALTDEARADRGERVYRRAEVCTMRFGARGLEAAFDASLRGDPGNGFRPPSRHGRTQPRVVAVPVVDGTPLATTLRRNVQETACEVVAGAPGAAAAVVLDVGNGAVVAIASKSADGLDHAVCGLRPGSVFKLATALAILESGVSPEETVTCQGRGMLTNGHKYVCDEAHGAVCLAEAFAHSCNAYFRTMAERVGPEALERACARLGFDAGPQLHLAGTKAGLERSPGRDGHWFPEHVGSIGMGTGEAIVSPVQVAAAYARVAVGGRCVTPFLVRDEQPSDVGVDPVLARFAPLLRAAARRVVTDGTGASVHGLAEIDAAGKSGTGDVPGTASNNAWFVAFAPYGAPRFVAVVVFERVPGHGASTAGAPVARLLAEALR